MSTNAKRSELTCEQLINAQSAGGLVANSAFVAAPDCGPARHLLSVSLRITESHMTTNTAILSRQDYAGRRADLFPGVALRLVSDGDDLVPLDRDLIRAPAGNSYWDISLSPGKVWSEPADNGFSRAVFPFQLSNILENDTHHGLATFLYDDEKVSSLRYQIAVQTKTFVVPGEFDVWGTLALGSEPLAEGVGEVEISGFHTETADERPLRAWGDLPSDLPANLLEAMQTGVGAESTIVNGLVIDDVIYATGCDTRAGDFPFPRGMKFGIWSATKTAFATVAWLRMAQALGKDCRDERICTLLPEALGIERWAEVTIGDCLNMASGMGTAAPQALPHDVFADYLLEEAQAQESALARKSFEFYFDWFLTLSQTQKNHAALACGAYSWGAGEVVRYRDQDLYLAGAAMDAWLKRERGADARLWEMVVKEVYTPALIHHPIKFHTVEDNRSRSVPLTDAGLLLTMDNIARLGRLLHDRGRSGDQQILHPSLLDEVFDPRHKKGLPTGTHTADGEVHYHAATWHLPYVARSGERFWLPSMRGYGGQMIQILPNGMTAFRFAYDPAGTEERYDGLTLARIADAVRDF